MILSAAHYMPDMDILTEEEAVQPLYQKAKTLFGQQKFHQAEKNMHLLIEQQKPNAIYFHFMAEINASIGRYNEQVEYLTLSLELQPNTCEYLVEIAFAHLSLCNFSDAYRYAELADIHNNGKSETYSLIAQIYNSLGEYTGAVNMLNHAIKLDFNNYQLFYELGLVLTMLGEIKPSVEAFQKSIKLNPSFGLAHAALTKARKASLNNNNIKQLESLVFEHRNPWTGLNIYHGLAKEFDDIGQYKESFKALNKGKKRLLSLCPHNPNTGAQTIKSLIDIYTEHAQEIRESNEGSKVAPIFVTGMPRTGTTIVERILTNHKDVVTLGERNQLGVLLKKQCNSNYSTLINAEALNKDWSTINFEKLGRDYIENVNYLAKNSHRFVDKLPLNILLAGVVLRALPEAKIICLLRDPLDTIIGNYRQIFEQASGTFAYSLDLYALANYVYEFRNLVSLLAKEFPTRFIVANYEELVSEPSTQARLLFEFCGLSWQNDYLDIHKNSAPIGTASAAQVQEPIHKKFMGKSKDYMFCLEEIKKAFDVERGDRNDSV